MVVEKASGAYFEVGYAKALGEKVIIVHQEGTEAAFLEAAVNYSIRHKTLGI